MVYRSSKKSFFYITFTRSLLLFFPVAVLCIVGAALLYHSEVETDLSKIHSAQSHTVNLATHSIGKVVQSITSDLAYLTTQQEFIELISQEIDPAHNHIKKHILSNWLAFSKIKSSYDQIRWLDHSGQERERVNYNNHKPVRVSDDKLQNKGKRYYFTDTFKLNRGEFFISPMDLNIEKGHIETPLKPMIRVGTPVYSRDGKKQGIMLLNYFAENLINEYTKHMQNPESVAWLLNSEGYWLKGPSAEQEWGFMYQNSQASMPWLYPEAWGKILASSQGQFIDDNGLWTYSTIYPIVEGQKTSTGTHETFAPSRSKLESNEYFWKAVHLLPHETYISINKQTGVPIVIVTIVLLTIIYFGCWLLARAWVREIKSEEKLILLNRVLEDTVTERTQQLLLAKKHAEDLAQTDELTGMNNRRSFFKQGKAISEQAIRYGLPYTVMMLDIDWFKKVNDTYGHLTGDEALIDVARIIMESIRAPDISGRIGGEEFAIILPQTTAQRTLEIAERLRKSIKKIAIPVADEEPLTLTVSIGIGQYGQEKQSLQEVLNIADKALYQAKEQGRNRVVLFSE